MTKKLDLNKVVNLINNDDILSNFYAFEDDEPVDLVEPNIDSINETIEKYDKVYLELAIFYHDYEFGGEGVFSLDNSVEFEIEFEPYYERYNFEVAGFGIYINDKLDIKYGYSTTEAPPSGHGMGYTTFHDFDDTRDDDEVKKQMFKYLDGLDIWE